MAGETAEVENTTLNDDLAAAWADVEGQRDGDDEDTTPEPLAASSEPSGAPVEDVEAREVPAEDTTSSEPNVAVAADESDKPPVGLAPAAREAWKDTPKAVREAVAKRERDFANGIKTYAENAKRAELMDRALAPFQQYFAMNGQPAGQQVASVLQTAALLQMGSPIQRAQKVAELIQQFGVDISTLDTILSGAQPQAQPQNNVHQIVQQAVAPYQQFMTEFQRQQQARQQQEVGKIHTTVAQFAADPTNEFYHDVKMDMADLMDLAAQRGQDLSLAEAYKRACAMNPNVSQVLEARTASQNIQQRRKAAVSVSGSPGGATAYAADSLRGAIEQAWESAGRV